MRIMISLRRNPGPLYFRLKVGLCLTLLAAVLLGLGALNVGRDRIAIHAEKAGTSFARSVEGLILENIDSPKTGAGRMISPVFRGVGAPEGAIVATVFSARHSLFGANPYNPHSFLPFSLEARLGRSAHPWTCDPPSSFARSRLQFLSALAAPGPEMPLALAIPQAVRPFPYPVLRREFLDQALNASKPEVRHRASACLAATGTPDSLSADRSPNREAVLRARSETDRAASGLSSDRYAIETISDRVALR